MRLRGGDSEGQSEASNSSGCNESDLIEGIAGLKDKDKPRGGPEHERLAQYLAMMSFEHLDNMTAESFQPQDDSDTDDPFDEIFTPAHKLWPENITDDVTEDDFYNFRDYRPGRYFPPPRSFVHLDSSRPTIPRHVLALRRGPDEEPYSISAAPDDRKAPGWKEREGQALVPWLEANATAACLPFLPPAPNHVRVPDQTLLQSNGSVVSSGLERECVPSIRKAVKVVQRARQNLMVTMDAGDHFPSRRIRIDSLATHGNEDDADSGSAIMISDYESQHSGEGRNVVIAGGGGHVRVWGQWEMNGQTEGRMLGVTSALLTRSSLKAAVIVRGSSSWLFQRCEIRAQVGNALMLYQDAVAVIEGCGVGGCGRKEKKATNGISVFGRASALILNTKAELVERGGVRFYENSTAVAIGLDIRYCGSYGMLVDHAANATVWGCRFARCRKGAFASSMKPTGCVLRAGNITMHGNVSRWWGPQRPTAEAPIASTDLLPAVTSTLQEKLSPAERRVVLQRLEAGGLSARMHASGVLPALTAHPCAAAESLPLAS